MDESEHCERHVGDAPCDARRRRTSTRSTADPDPAAAEFQDYLTSMAWGVWTREGALSTARSQPAGDGHDRGARADGGVRLHASSTRPDRRHRRRARRAAVPDRRLLRRARRASRLGGRSEAARAAREDRLTVETVGFVGLGNMGSVLAANLVGRGPHRHRATTPPARQRAPAGVDARRRRSPTSRRARRRRRAAACPTAPRRSRSRARSWPRPIAAPRTWSTRRRSVSRAARAVDDAARRSTASRTSTRRCRVASRARGPHARGDVRRRATTRARTSSRCSRG